MQASVAERFWSKVNEDGPMMKGMETKCWLWTAAVFGKTNYGAFQLERQAHRAHRVAWMLTFGEIPAALFVLHRCDNPKCVRPEHLFLGTHTDNMNDRDSKGRQAQGERHAMTTLPDLRGRLSKIMSSSKKHKESRPKGSTHWNSQVTERDVLKIRAEYTGKYGQYISLAKKYKTTRVVIMNIVKRKTWQHVLPTGW